MNDFWQEYNKAYGDESLKDPSPSLLTRLFLLFSLSIDKLFGRKTQHAISAVKTSLKKSQNEFINDFSIWKKEAKFEGAAIQGWGLNDLKPKVANELKKRTEFSLNLITQTNEKHKAILKERLFGILSNNTDVSPEAMAKALNIDSEAKKVIKHQQSIINDQTTKFEATLSRIEAEMGGAFAFTWRTRFDLAVVGNPQGKYPNGNALHGDHYAREKQVYFMKDAFPNSWVYKYDLVKINALKWDDFKDGLPGMPINCRCWANYIYDLRELPADILKKILTKQGKKYINGELELDDADKFPNLVGDENNLDLESRIY